MFGTLGAPELIIIGLIVVLLFGVGKISGLGREVGSSIKEFRKAVKDEDAEKAAPVPALAPQQYAAVQPPVAQYGPNGPVVYAPPPQYAPAPQPPYAPAPPPQYAQPQYAPAPQPQYAPQPQQYAPAPPPQAPPAQPSGGQSTIF